MKVSDVRIYRNALTVGTLAFVCGLGAGLLPVTAHASTNNLFGQGRPLGTGVVSNITGAAGTGIVPWALISGYGNSHQIGFTASYGNLTTPETSLNTYSVAAGIFNRVEVSVGQQSFNMAPTTLFTQDIVGLKVRVLGNILKSESPWLPQIAVGMNYHHSENTTLVKLSGAQNGSGETYYIAATKLWGHGLFGHTTLLDFTLNGTKANLNGLVGFGGPTNPGYKVEPEVSGAVFLDPHVVVGGDWREMPNNAGTLAATAYSSRAWKDAFVAYLPNKSLSLVLGYAMLGKVAGTPNQNSLYTSMTVSF